jgi:hypothetical protein
MHACLHRFTRVRYRAVHSSVDALIGAVLVSIPADDRADAAARYYFLIDGQQVGPLAADELLEAGLTSETPVWWPGEADWLPARLVPELAALVDAPPQWAITAEQTGVLGSNTWQPVTQRVDTGALRWLTHGELGLRRSFRVGLSMYGDGLMLTLAGGILFTAAVYLGGSSERPRYDPDQRAIVIDSFPEYHRLADIFGFTSIGCGLIGILILLLGVALLLMFVYRAWQAIQDGDTAVAPALAAGLLFVPLFNCYWVFVGLAGLAPNVNAFVRRHGLRARPASTSLGVVVSVLFVLGLLPFIGLGPLLLTVLLFPVFLRSVQRSLLEACDEASIILDDRPVLEPTELVEARRPRARRRALTITAALLGLLGMEMLLFGGIGSLMVGRDYFAERRQIEAAEEAVAHLRTLPALPPPLQEALATHEAEIDDWHRDSPFRAAMPIVLAVFGGGIVFLVLAVALARSASRGSRSSL